jgi:hypothetical protein
LQTVELMKLVSLLFLLLSSPLVWLLGATG